jgi:hypothetical protein
VKGGWRKLPNEELHNFYTLPNIIRIMKSTTIRWVGCGGHRRVYGREKKFIQNFGRNI